MNTKFFEKILFYAIPWLYPFVCNAGLVDSEIKTKMNDRVTQISQTSGLDPTSSVSDVISTVISGFLSFLGIIFIILIILAGYNWMSARGDEQKVEKAKETIQRAIIGLIIIIAAYAITYFVFQRLPGGTGPGGSGFGS